MAAQSMARPAQKRIYAHGEIDEVEDKCDEWEGGLNESMGKCMDCQRTACVQYVACARQHRRTLINSCIGCTT
eukprot:scaffold125394_cov32-Tisochrysis_lutea.AAC.5